MYQKEVIAEGKSTYCSPQKGSFLYIIVFVHALCKKGKMFVFVCFFLFLFFHFYKYDVSYKMLSHLKVHSILFLNIENIVTTISYSNT